MLGLQNSGYTIAPWTRSTRSPGSRRWPGTCAATWTTRSPGPPAGRRPDPDADRVALPGVPVRRERADRRGRRHGRERRVRPDAPAPAPARARRGRAGDPGRRAAGAAGRSRPPSTACPTWSATSLPGIGSNSWVISGNLTTTGKPILANDPHLSPSMPSIWYQMGLHCACAFNVEGFTFSGVPGVIIGHNARDRVGLHQPQPRRHRPLPGEGQGRRVRGRRRVADRWRSGPDDQGRRREAGARSPCVPPTTVRCSPTCPRTCRRSRRSRTSTRPAARPRPAAPSTAADGVTYAVALKWTALDPGTTMDALFAVDEASDWTIVPGRGRAVRRCRRRTWSTPTSTATSATSRPARSRSARKGDGRWPAPGWDSRLRLAGLHPVRAAADRGEPGRRLHRHREPGGHRPGRPTSRS